MAYFRCTGGSGSNILNPLIPIMTSNTTPSGIASSNSILDTNRGAWKAFNIQDTGTNNRWLSKQSELGAYLRYQFSSPVIIKKIEYLVCASDYNATVQDVNCYFDISTDNVNWTRITTDATNNTKGKQKQLLDVMPARANYIRFSASGNVVVGGASDYYVQMHSLQVYGETTN